MIVDYMAKNDPIVPTVDNNWKITGVDIDVDSAERKAYIEKINAGELATPYNKAINLEEYNNVIVDGKVNSASATDEDQNGTETFFYRLRDLAVILKGTDLAFNVDWNEAAARVEITKGVEYTAQILPPAEAPVANNIADLTLLVDGAPVTVKANLVGGNYFVTAEGLNAILGANAVTAEGIMTLSAKNTAATGVAG